MTMAFSKVESRHIARHITVSMQWLRHWRVTGSQRDCEAAIICARMALERTQKLDMAGPRELCEIRCLAMSAQIESELAELRQIMRQCLAKIRESGAVKQADADIPPVTAPGAEEPPRFPVTPTKNLSG